MLTGVRALGGVGGGLSVGGFLAAVAGLLLGSLAAVTEALALAAGLSVVALAARRLLAGGIDAASVGTVAGVGLAAALVAALDATGAGADVSRFQIGAGLFLVGFLLYAAVWEGGRQVLARVPDVRAERAGDRPGA